MDSKKNFDHRIATLKFASVYPHYVNKVVGKGRTVEELHTVITWLTGFDNRKIQNLIEQKVTFRKFLHKPNSIPMLNSSPVLFAVTGWKILKILWYKKPGTLTSWWTN